MLVLAMNCPWTLLFHGRTKEVMQCLDLVLSIFICLHLMATEVKSDAAGRSSNRVQIRPFWNHLSYHT